VNLFIVIGTIFPVHLTYSPSVCQFSSWLLSFSDRRWSSWMEDTPVLRCWRRSAKLNRDRTKNRKQKKNQTEKEAETMRKSTFKVNWASRLLGRKWKWKRRISGRYPFGFQTIVLPFSVSFQEADGRTDDYLQAILCIKADSLLFVCFFLGL